MCLLNSLTLLIRLLAGGSAQWWPHTELHPHLPRQEMAGHWLLRHVSLHKWISRSRIILASYCAVCEFPKRMNLTMRGLCSTGNVICNVWNCSLITFLTPKPVCRHKTDGGILWYWVFHRGLCQQEAPLAWAGQKPHLLPPKDQGLAAGVLLRDWEVCWPPCWWHWPIRLLSPWQTKMADLWRHLPDVWRFWANI